MLLNSHNHISVVNIYYIQGETNTHTHVHTYLENEGVVTYFDTVRCSCCVHIEDLLGEILTSVMDDAK